MLEVSVSIPNEAQWRAALADLDRGSYFVGPEHETLSTAGSLLAEEARRRVAKAFGTLGSAIGSEIDGLHSVKVGILKNVSGPAGKAGTQEYGYYVEKGRRPGSMPPPGVLRAWMTKKGYQGSEYLLRRTIARKGVRPRPFLAPALDAKQKQIVGIAAAAYQKGLDRFAAATGGGGFLSRIGSFFRGLFS